MDAEKKKYEKIRRDLNVLFMHALSEKEQKMVHNFMLLDTKLVEQKERERILKIIESEEWFCYSGGRSTDFMDTFDIETSVIELKERISKKPSGSLDNGNV